MTSGGDSPGMNAAIRAVVRETISTGHEAVGYAEGYRGLTEEPALPLSSASVSEIIDRGGTILRTARYRPFLERSVQEKAAAKVLAENIDGLVVVGGEGSMRGAKVLQDLGVKVVGVPASIDNDVYGTEYSIGFDTAVNTVLDAMSKLRDTASAHERVFVIEVMGRKSGAIAISAAICGGADHVLLPGTAADEPQVTEELCDLIERRDRAGKTHTLIVVAEGAGSAADVAAGIRRCTDKEVRISVLGHIQRGGSPSSLDRLLASRLGAAAVDLLAEGKSGVMMGLRQGIVQSIALEETYSNPVAVDPSLRQLVRRLTI